MKRVFLDANVLFSAAYSEGSSLRLFFDVVGKLEGADLVATGYVITEARRNIGRKRPSRLPELETLLEVLTILEEPSAELMEELAPLVPDADDAPVLAGAVSGGADVLVTGNERDFRNLYGKEVRGVLVLRPRDALDLLTP